MTNEELVALIRSGIDAPGNMFLLYDQNRGLIAKIARKYVAYEEMDDLMQEGYLGLYAAVYAYREEEGAAFVTYAGYWIRQAIHRYVEDCSSVVRIPVHRQEDLHRYKKMVSDFKKYYGREPSDRELRALLHISEETLDNIRQAAVMGKIRSFSEPLDDENGGTLGDLVKCDGFEDGLVDRMDRQQLQHELWSIVDELPDQQREVIRSRYLYSKTMKQAGDSQGLSIERIRQIQAKALRRLRLNKYAGRLEPYLTDIQTCIAYSGNGVGNFTRTWTSSTERAVLCMESTENGRQCQPLVYRV